MIRARRDPNLTARIIARTPLFYEKRAGERADAAASGPPAYVRAGSSLARLGESLTVVQDDANFVAVIDRDRKRAVALPLPAGPGGQRLFDAAHGNRDDKLDLEACVALPADGGGAFLVAFGSGSKPQRERVVVVRWRGSAHAPPEVSLHEGTALYAALRGARDFAGSALNVEGAVYLGGDRIRLFQRGNGAARDGVPPVDATGDLAWSALWDHLRDPGGAPAPAPENVVQYDLGELQGHRLTFSDAEAVGSGGVVLYSASAEASPAADRDGAVQGSVLGVIDGERGGARYAELRAVDGGAAATFAEKIEGLSVDADNPRRAYFVVDDDRDQPSELFEVELEGPWYGG